MDKIKMTTPLVEMDGDEMTRILWKMIKDELLLPYIDLKTEYYDLGLEHRNETNDQVTIDSALANKKLRRGCKMCNDHSKRSPHDGIQSERNVERVRTGTIRAIMDGTVFRTPIVVKGHRTMRTQLEKRQSHWQRHAYGDVYKASEIKVPCAGKAELVFTAEDGTETRELIHEFDGPGILQGMHNTEKSIRSFAKSCFNYALDTKQDLWFATKDTISKKIRSHLQGYFPGNLRRRV